jgi:MarR family transcriptional regulator, organic hydroperoxide resistance regulator
MQNAMPRVDDLLCFSLYAAANAMNRVYQPLLESLQVTYPQYLVLNTLWAKDGQPVSQIGHRLGLESNTLTPLLKRMEAAGLLRRTRSENDERSVLITLTPKGRNLRKKACNIPACILGATGLSLSEAMALKNELAALRVNLAANLEAA